MSNETDPLPQRPTQHDQPLPLDYSNLHPPSRTPKFAFLAGRISLYAIIVQIVWTLAIPTILFLAWCTPPSEQSRWVFVVLWPSFVALVFGGYSMVMAGFNRRNIPGMIDLFLAIVIIIVVASIASNMRKAVTGVGIRGHSKFRTLGLNRECPRIHARHKS
jgi:hypothetical protein